MLKKLLNKKPETIYKLILIKPNALAFGLID